MRTEHACDFILDSDLFLTKYHVESAENSISETLHSKIYWGSMPPDPSRGSCDDQLKNSIFLAPPTSNYASPSLDYEYSDPLEVAASAGARLSTPEKASISRKRIRFYDLGRERLSFTVSVVNIL